MKTKAQAVRVASPLPHTDRSDDIWHSLQKLEKMLKSCRSDYSKKLYDKAIKGSERSKGMAEGLGIFGSKYVGSALRIIELCESKLDSMRQAVAVKGLAARKREHGALELNEKRMMLIYQELCKIAREYGRSEFQVNAVTGVAHCIEKEYGVGIVRAKDIRRQMIRYGIPVEWDPENDHIFYVNTKKLLRYGLSNDLEIPYMHALLTLTQ
jgi:hypothetical protein